MRAHLSACRRSPCGIFLSPAELFYYSNTYNNLYRFPSLKGHLIGHRVSNQMSRNHFAVTFNINRKIFTLYHKNVEYRLILRPIFAYLVGKITKHIYTLDKFLRG